MPRWCDAELSNFLVILFWIRFLAHRSQERLGSDASHPSFLVLMLDDMQVLTSTLPGSSWNCGGATPPDRLH